MTAPARPTAIRYVILALTVCVAVLLYLDRNCVGFVIQYIRQNLGLTEDQANFLLSAFYITYAIGQIPGGWLSDRFGTRLMLALYLFIWSSLTGLMGFVHGYLLLVLFRLGCGLFEAGAYPACAGLIRRWIPFEKRGLASGIVSIGGRLGGTITPITTAYLMVLFVPVSAPSFLAEPDLLHPRQLARDMTLEESALGKHLLETLSPRDRQTVEEIATLTEGTPPSAEQRSALTEALNHALKQADLTQGLDLDATLLKLNQPDRKLFEPTASPRPENEIVRRNRLLLEVLLPDRFRRLYGESWKPVLMIYGLIGVILAFVFWGFYRDTPRQHFLSNEAEAELVEAHDKTIDQAAPPMPASFLWRGIFTSRGLWASSVVQFGTNFGWVFLVTIMPTYLQRVHEAPEVTRGWMTFWPSCVALPMLLVGGWWTDWLTKRYGPYWGRCFPIASTRILAAAAFAACIFLDGPWPVTLALCAFSLVNDTGLPAIWAYNLDVGGRNVGVVLGWGNMWGNLGAAFSPLALGYVLKSFVDVEVSHPPAEWRLGYNAVFLTCAGMYLFIGLVAFFIDASKPIGADRSIPLVVT
jgi:MFS family permease